MKLYTILSLLAFSEGAQVMVFTLMIPVLEAQWGISKYINGLQASLIFVSFLVGSVLSGQIADRFGRRLPIMVSCGSMTLLSFASAASPNIVVLILLRVFLGLLVGFFGPLAATMLAELTPMKVRGKFMCLLTMNISLGQIFGICMGYLCLSNLSDGDWRLLIVLCTISGAMSWILCVFALDESPRYEILNGNHQKAFDLIDKINAQNGRKTFHSLTEEQKDKLVKWSNEVVANFENNGAASLKALFQGKGKIITPILWFNWLSSSFTYYAIIIFMPEIIEKLEGVPPSDKQDISLILISTMFEIMSVIFSALLIELKHFGRKNSMIIFYFLSSVGFLLVYFFGTTPNKFIVWVTFAKVAVAMTFIFLYQFTSEVYPTKYRTTGIGLIKNIFLGMSNGVGRLGGILMPWVCVGLTNLNLLAPFIACLVLSFVSGILSAFLPYDTRGMELDSIKEEEKEMQKPQKAN